MLPSPTVYSWYMPEIAEFVADYAKHHYPSDVFMQNYDPGLDNLHLPLMDAFWYNSLAEMFEGGYPDLLKHRYYCNGSSEAIFHLLARHEMQFPNVPLYQFAGEYQGYDAYAKSLGTRFVNIEHGRDTSILTPGVFFVSVPSAVDGNAVDPSVLEKIARCHYLVIDCAYAGMTDAQPEIPFSIGNRVTAIVASMSKPFGLYYHRIGFLWARDPVMSLYGNKWFKNAFSISLAQELLTSPGGIDAQSLQYKYRQWQTRACTEASEYLAMDVHPSDVWLLGHGYPDTAFDSQAASQFQRGPAYRFCLTPYYMEYARESR